MPISSWVITRSLSSNPIWFEALDELSVCMDSTPPLFSKGRCD